MGRVSKAMFDSDEEDGDDGGGNGDGDLKGQRPRKAKETDMRLLYPRGRTPVYYPMYGAIKRPMYYRLRDIEQGRANRTVCRWMTVVIPNSVWKPRAQTWGDIRKEGNGPMYECIISFFLMMYHQLCHDGRMIPSRDGGPGKVRFSQGLYCERVLAKHTDQILGVAPVAAAAASAAVPAAAAAAAAAPAAPAPGIVASVADDDDYVDETPEIVQRVIEECQNTLQPADGKSLAETKETKAQRAEREDAAAELYTLRRDYKADARPPPPQDTVATRLHLIWEDLACDLADPGPDPDPAVMLDEACRAAAAIARAEAAGAGGGGAADDAGGDGDDDDEDDPAARRRRTRERAEAKRRHEKARAKQIRLMEEEKNYSIGAKGKSRIDCAYYNVKRLLYLKQVKRPDTTNGKAINECIDRIKGLHALFGRLNDYANTHQPNPSDAYGTDVRRSMFSDLNPLRPHEIFDPEQQVARSTDDGSVLQTHIDRYETLYPNGKVIDVSHVPKERAEKFCIVFPQPRCVWQLPDEWFHFWDCLMPFVSIDDSRVDLEEKFVEQCALMSPEERYESYVELLFSRYATLAYNQDAQTKFKGAIEWLRIILKGRIGSTEKPNPAIVIPHVPHIASMPGMEADGPRATYEEESSNGRRRMRSIVNVARARIDLCGSVRLASRNDDFMTTNDGVLDNEHIAQRLRRHNLYRELFVDQRLEMEAVMVKPPPELSFESVNEDNLADKKAVSARLDQMLDRLKARARSDDGRRTSDRLVDGKYDPHTDPEYIAFEKAQWAAYRDVAYERLSRILMRGEGKLSEGADAHIKAIRNFLKRNKNFYKYREKGFVQFADTSDCMEMLTWLSSVFKITGGNYKNHRINMQIIFGAFTSYLRLDMAHNSLLFGDPSTGKSFAMKIIGEIFIPDTSENVANMSTMSEMTDVSDISDKLIFIEEADPDVLYVSANGSASENALQKQKLWKNKLTAYVQKWKRFHKEKNGTTSTRRGTVFGGNSHVQGHNPLHGKTFEAAMLTRYSQEYFQASARDVMRQPIWQKADNRAEDNRMIDSNTERFRVFQQLVYMTFKAIRCSCMDAPSMNWAMGQVYKILDEAATRGATGTQESRNLIRVQLQIMSITVARAVYQMFFLSKASTINTFSKSETFQLQHIDRLKGLLVPTTEEIVFGMLLMAGQFQDRSTEMVVRAIKRVWFQDAPPADQHPLRNYYPIFPVPEDILEREMTWFKSDPIQAEFKQDPAAFELKYGMGYRGSANTITSSLTGGKLVIVDTHRLKIPGNLESVKKGLESCIVNTMGFKALGLGTAVSLLTSSPTQRPQSDVRRCQDRLESHFNLLDEKRDVGQSGHVVLVATSLISATQSRRPVYEAIHKHLASKLNDGPMMFAPETRDDGTALWRFFNVKKDPQAGKFIIKPIQRISKEERRQQRRIHGMRADEEYDPGRHDVDVMRAFQDARGVELDDASEFDLFSFKERWEAVGDRGVGMPAYVESAIPANSVAGRSRDPGYYDDSAGTVAPPNYSDQKELRMDADAPQFAMQFLHDPTLPSATGAVPSGGRGGGRGRKRTAAAAAAAVAASASAAAVNAVPSGGRAESSALAVDLTAEEQMIMFREVNDDAVPASASEQRPMMRAVSNPFPQPPGGSSSIFNGSARRVTTGRGSRANVLDVRGLDPPQSGTPRSAAVPVLTGAS
jgi:hypothetical protein